MRSREVILNYAKGLHTRTAAAVVNTADVIQNKYQVRLFINFRDRRVPATSLMPLVNLKIRDKDRLILIASGSHEEQALNEFEHLFESGFEDLTTQTINDIDDILNENMITNEEIFHNIANGIIVTDQADRVILFNSFAERLFKMSSDHVIGEPFASLLPYPDLELKADAPETMIRKVIHNQVLLITRRPLVIDGKARGTIAILQNISRLEKVKGELKEVKELKERLQLILKFVQDGICVMDKQGIINYVNDAYLKIQKLKRSDVIGKSISELSPHGVRQTVLKTGHGVKNKIIKKNNDVMIISNVSPIVVDDEQVGAISIVKDFREIQHLTEKLNRVTSRAEYLEEELIRSRNPEKIFSNFIGKSGKIIDALSVALKAARTKATILIRGESGTGKEMIAKGIHYASAYRNGPFIRVNCASIPENLFESELFGHEKGSFTGAISRRLGKFELAQHGTIFLDEIGELNTHMQAKILRVLQEKEIQRIGSETVQKLDIRIIAATNRDLEAMVKTGDFREDLYYRLNVIPIYLPPLRERKQDIALLVDYFMNRFQNDREHPLLGISNDAMESLLAYAWPGNVREIENLFERLFTLVDNDYIEAEDLPAYIRGKKLSTQHVQDHDLFASDRVLPMDDYEKAIIKKALEKYGSCNAAGKALHLNHKTVAAKARKFNLIQ
ncbi:sigma 54-interacting transcriptional regulator [Sporolactobacillus kofuensis]|uniref:HTH-type transcriptional regulatory protein TyrR n=1 Tax=Sporolactobacillus kofuensis TaxID=269672 RepID=A0ABW1WDA9_9BACL|nr:sigma 54-interacting transcriptional regulator [Sporolactobacillus kofuensis]MCO7175454.1 sigma 54-interacting transcriptional regulator [Sporolactobacillus kofuensis]